MAILEVSHIEKHFGKTNVLKDVSFSMEEGTALAIIGSSGSGKTTLLRCLNFLERPNSGTITVNGETLFDAASAGAEKMRNFAKSVYILEWSFSPLICFRSIPHCRM